MGADHRSCDIQPHSEAQSSGQNLSAASALGIEVSPRKIKVSSGEAAKLPLAAESYEEIEALKKSRQAEVSSGETTDGETAKLVARAKSGSSAETAKSQAATTFRGEIEATKKSWQAAVSSGETAGSPPATRSRDEIEALKKNWEADPYFDFPLPAEVPELKVKILAALWRVHPAPLGLSELYVNCGCEGPMTLFALAIFGMELAGWLRDTLSGPLKTALTHKGIHVIFSLALAGRLNNVEFAHAKKRRLARADAQACAARKAASAGYC